MRVHIIKVVFGVIVIGCFSILFSSQSYSQGIRGIVKTSEGEPLSYASVYMRNLGDGVPTNQDGAYEFRLQHGVYDVLVQYLGY